MDPVGDGRVEALAVEGKVADGSRRKVAGGGSSESSSSDPRAADAGTDSLVSEIGVDRIEEPVAGG
jgi:hypothetical protein